MDKAVELVLDEYHERLQEEKAARMRQPNLRRSDGDDDLMRAVGPCTGRLLNLLVGSLRSPKVLELGTSFGYSGIWLAEAARSNGGRVVTVEMYERKSAYARDMAAKAGLADYIDFRVGDALEVIASMPHGIDFVLVDLWKDLYEPCLEAFFPKLNPGAVIVADNMIRPGNEEVRRYGRAVRAKPGISSVQLPIGSGIEVSCFNPLSPYAA